MNLEIVIALSHKRFSEYWLPLLSGGLLSLSFSRPGFSPLAWIAFLPLFFSIAEQTPKKAFLSGWLTGLVYFGGTLYWITPTLWHGGLPWFFSIFVSLLLISYLGLYLGLFSALLKYAIDEKGRRGLLVAPVLWVVLEWVKGHFLTGFPWASLAYSQTEFLSMIQIADFGSIYVVGFVMMFCNRALYCSLRGLFHEGSHSDGFDWQPLVLAGLVFCMSFFYGTFRLSESLETKKQISLAVIQGNIAQDKKWDRSFQRETLEVYLRLSEAVLKDSRKKPELMLWPESSLPFIFGTEAVYEKELRGFSRNMDVPLLFGAPSMGVASEGKISLRNSAYLISPDSEHVAQYDKMHLVPFGEYVPFPELLFFIKKLVQGLADFSPGDKAVIFEVGQARLGTAICFELIFPELVRRFVQNGATLMTTITNDAWFGDTSAPDQHFSMMVFRAIENRISFARAANTGISGFVDARGRVISKTTLFNEDSASATLDLRGETTLYTRFGDFFVAFCVIIALYFLCIAFMKRRTKNAV